MITETEFIHLLRRWFLTPFCLFTLAWHPRKKCARVSQEMALFALEIAHLATSMESTPLLEKVSSYGLLPRLWLQMVYEKVKGLTSGQSLPRIKLSWVPPPPLPSPAPGVSGLKLEIKTYLATWQLQAAYVFVWSFVLQILTVLFTLYFRDVYHHIQSRRREKMEFWISIR